VTPEDAAELAADRKAIRKLTAVKLIADTEGLRRTFYGPSPGLNVPAHLHAMANGERLAWAMLVWSLMFAENAPPRLPGGALVDTGIGVRSARIVAERGEFYSVPGDVESPMWLGHVEAAMNAATAREGDLLFESIHDGLADNPLSFASSIGVSALQAIEEINARPGVVALVCLLGCASHNADLWSVAGYAYRLTYAFMTSYDLGPDIGLSSILPEWSAISDDLSPGQALRVLAMLSRATSWIIGGDPDQPVELGVENIVASPYGLSKETAGDTQMDAVRYAIEMIKAHRDPDPKLLAKTVNGFTGLQRAQATWAMANLLGERVRFLWGA
jgi:hypothetical protein